MSLEELLQVIEKAAQEQSTELDLSGHNLTALPIEIGKLIYLKKLILGKYIYDEKGRYTGSIGNNLSVLPAEIGQLINLEELHIARNCFRSVPTVIFQLTNLRALNFRSNRLSNLPPEIIQLSNLQGLYLSQNHLSSLPPEIIQLSNLKELYFSYNQLSNLPPEIGQLSNLESLTLSNNQLSSLPPEIGQLSNLESLNLSSNHLSNLPPEIGQLSNLESLTLSNNQLSSLPPEIGQLSNLKSLTLSNNQLSSLPPEIGQLSNLESLTLSNNQLSSLPPEIGQLSNLESLKINNNQLSSLPPEIGRISNLESLTLSKNQLSSLPPKIGQLSNLESLKITENQLSSLPLEVGQLSNLQELYLNSNQLSSLPPKIGELSNLKSLRLSYNQLTSLPKEVGQLSNLQELYLSHNNLSSLPLTIRNPQNLKKLDIRGNPLPIPPEILGSKYLNQEPGNVSEILDFYFRVQDPNETEPLYEAKLLIVGEGGAGKTSLAKKIQDENYQLQPEEKSTQGIDVIEWKFPLSNGREFRVNIWDFGGQEIYHQTHQFFLTKRSLYALVADSRKENTDFYWWLKIVELLSDNSAVVIVKNEKQDRICEINEHQLRGEFTNLEKIVATNLASNRGLREIKKIISQYISRLEQVGIPLPKIWVRVRSALENDSRNYISLEEYYGLCKTNGLSDRKDMLQLSGYLHDLGVCLHFQDDPTLKHWIILKPQWGTTAVYKVLDNKSVRKNLGRFSNDDLASTWDDSKYSEMRDELLQLMIRFKLCYPIRDHPHNYIAPQLLELNPPDYSWDNEHNLILRYKYEFMPKGILARFIVETHPWIEQLSLVWRSGVVLNKNDTRAEIIENYNLKEIKVRVTGNRKKELLAVITHELDKIHNSFERLRYTTLVPCNCTTCIGSQQPYPYPLENLHRRLSAGRYQIECEISFEMVDVRRLIDDVNLPPLRDFQKSYSTSTPLQSQLEKDKNDSINITINNVYSPSSTPAQTHNSAVKTILVLASNPHSTSRLRLDQEVREIDALLQRAKKRELFNLQQRWAVRVRDVYESLLDFNPCIVHFSGHGSGEDGLVLEDETSNLHLVETAALAGLFELFADSIECVVLNACYSEVQASAIALHIPYVIGMKKDIGDQAAIKFATGFYSALSAGESVEFAYKLACTVIQLDGIGEHLTPTLKKKL